MSIEDPSKDWDWVLHVGIECGTLKTAQMSPLYTQVCGCGFSGTPFIILRTWMIYFFGKLSAECYKVFHIL